jgi:hypothetical protein
MTSEEYFFSLEELLEKALKNFKEKLQEFNPFYNYSDSFDDGGEWRRQNQLHEDLKREAMNCEQKQVLLDQYMNFKHIKE